MGTKKLCVCNRMRNTLVGLEVDLFDTTSETIPSLVNDLAHISDTGLYLSPFRGIPRDHRISRFDLVYLDERGRVLRSVPQCSALECEPFKGQPASALVLPCGSIESSQINSGDQLTICAAGAMLPQPWNTSASSGIEAHTVECQKDFHCTRDAAFSNPDAASDQIKSAIERLDQEDESQEQAKPSVMMRIVRWMLPERAPRNRRRSTRHPLPGLVAYYWTGGAPQAFKVGDVSINGVYLLTEERWTPGAMILVTLQRTDIEEAGQEDAICIQSKVVRWGLDGMGFEFFPARAVALNTGELLSRRRSDREALPRFLQRLKLPGEEIRLN